MRRQDPEAQAKIYKRSTQFQSMRRCCLRTLNYWTEGKQNREIQGLILITLHTAVNIPERQHSCMWITTNRVYQAKRPDQGQGLACCYMLLRARLASQSKKLTTEILANGDFPSGLDQNGRPRTLNTSLQFASSKTLRLRDGQVPPYQSRTEI